MLFTKESVLFPFYCMTTGKEEKKYSLCPFRINSNPILAIPSFLKNFVYCCFYNSLQKKICCEISNRHHQEILSIWAHTNTNESKNQKNQAIFLDCLNGCTHGTLGNMGKPYISPTQPFPFPLCARGSEVTSVVFCISAPTTREKRQLLL